jgi:hypothetical protein
MIKSILAGLAVLGIGILCEEKPKPDPFAGKTNLIKVNGVSCGFFDAMEADGTTLHITGLTFRKDQIPLIWSGGFVVKPSQRLGFTVDAEGEVHENVWVEYMDPYVEQQDTITIARMECLVENQEEQPGQESE